MKLRLTAPGRFAVIRDAAFSALLWAGVPAAIAGAYMYFFAADQYQALAQFVVRGDTFAVGADAGGTLGDLIEINTSQDTRIAADFIASGAALPELQQTLDMTRVFSAPDLDFLSGLSSGASVETQRDFWSDQASAEVDAVSGIVSVRIKAFSAADAHALVASAIVATEEKLNALHHLTLEGAARLATDRADAAAARLERARAEIKAFREKYNAVDLNAGASSTFELLSNLRRQRISDRSELAVLRAQGAGNSPIIKGLEARIAATDNQIIALEKDLTGALDGDEEAASAAIEAYDRLVLREDMASQFFARTQLALFRADNRLGKRQIYLDVFVPPALPDEPEFPRRARIVLAILAGALALWALVRLVWAGIRSHEV